MTENDVWFLLEKDDFYKQFLEKKEGTEVKIQLGPQCLSVAEQIKKLADGIALLDKELQKQVLSNYENLLSQATWVEKLEGILSMMHNHTQCLLSGVERLRSKIVEPYEKIEMQTAMLERLHTTSDLLRRVSRIQHLTKRLNAQMQADSSDIVKAAQSLCELASLCEDVDLSGLEILEEDQRRIRSYRHDVERQAKLLLNDGLHTRNVPLVLTAVQVFHNLGSLEQAVKVVVDAAKEKIVTKLNEGLDVSALTQIHSIDLNKSRGAPGRAVMPSPGNTSMFRSRLWSALEGVFEALYTGCCQVDLLQRVLRKKVKDPGILHQHHNASYLELLAEDKRNLSEKFWKEVTTLLALHIAQIAQSSTFIKQALEGEYPKFLRLYLDVCKRLQADTNNSSSSDRQDVYSGIYKTQQSSPFEINREVVVSFENAYLSRSVSRLLDPVHLMFSSDSVPPHEEIDTLIRTMTSELSVSLVDISLSRTVSRNIGKAVRLFCLKCEQMVVTSGEATQVIELPTAGQVLNVSLANLVHYLSSQVLRVVSNMKNSLPQESSTILIESLTNIETLTVGIITPLLLSVADAIEAIIITMHNEDYSSELVPVKDSAPANKKLESQCSLYMKELHSFVARAANNYLSPFHNQEIVTKCCMPVAKKSIDLFLYNVSVVRPLGEGGRVKLSADFVQLESAISPLCKQLSDLGRPYRTLRSFRSLLFLDPDDVVASPALGEVVPYSLALLMLFSRGPPELLSPHQSASWSVSRFCTWLDNHPAERERLEFISGALQRYQQNVRQRGETSFHLVYPIMVHLLEKGVEHSTKSQQ